MQNIVRTRFKVQACNNARVTLAAKPDDITQSYEIIIGGGGNKRSVIRTAISGPNVAVNRYPGLLSCNESRWFWVGWQRGKIEVGQGVLYGKFRFLLFQDPNPRDVTAMSFSSGDGATAQYKYLEPNGKENYVESN